MTPGIVAESDLSGTTKSEYVFFNGERVARRDGVNGAGGVFYYFSDHLKTASVITDSAGNIKAESDYYPWGGELQFVNADSNHYKFTGKERDTDTGLDYFGARYYANALGRFVTADWSSAPAAVPYADYRSPQSLNLYSYVRNNPETLIDPDGHCCWDWIKQHAKSAAVGILKGVGTLVAFNPPTPTVTTTETVTGIHVAENAQAAADAIENAVPPEFRPNNTTEEVFTLGTIAVLTLTGVGEELEEGGVVVREAVSDGLASFDEAREAAFQHAGMTDGNVTFTRADPATGTITEFRGSGGAEVGYDKPHPNTPGPSHDQNHVSAQAPGKRGQGGGARQNFPYSGPQHPSRIGPPNKDIDAVTPH